MTAYKRTGILPGSALHSILNHTHDLDVVKSTGALDRKFWYLNDGTPTEGVGLRLASAGVSTPDGTNVSAKDILEIRKLYSGGSPDLGYIRVKGLIVEGENTIVFHEEMQVADNLIILNSNLKPSTPPAPAVPPDSEGGGFHILRGNEEPARLQWIEDGDGGEDSYFGITKGDATSFSEIVRYLELAGKTAPTFIGDDSESYTNIAPEADTLYATLHALDVAIGALSGGHDALTLSDAVGTTVATLLSLNVNDQVLDVAKPTSPYKVWASDPTTSAGSPKYPSWQTLSAGFINQTGAALHLALFDTSNNLNHIVTGTGGSPKTTKVVLSNASPDNNRVYTIDTSIASSTFVMTEGIQRIDGEKTFATRVELKSYLSFPREDATKTNYYNIYPGTLTRDEALNFILPDGYPDTLTGSIGFTYDGDKTVKLTCESGVAHAPVTIRANDNPITYGAQHLLSLGGDSNQEIDLVKYGAASNNLVFATQTVSGGTTKVPVFRSLVAADLPSFTAQYLILADATGKLNTQYIAPSETKWTQIKVAANNSANTTYTIPTLNADADFIMSLGAQNIYGVKTFYGKTDGTADYSIIFGAAAAANRVTAKFQTGTSTNFVGLKAPDSAATITYILPTAPADQDKTFILKGSRPSSGVSTMSWIELPDLSSLHAAVTLTNDAKKLLSLSGQEIGLVSKTKNLFWASPSTGSGNLVPDYRAIALADISPVTSVSTFAASVGTDLDDFTYLTSHGYLDTDFDLQSVLKGIDNALDNAGLGVVATYMTKVAGEAISAGMPIYMKSDGKVWKASAAAIGSARVIGIAETSAAQADESIKIMVKGEFLFSSSPGWTPGVPIYLSTTAGGYLTDISGLTSDNCIVKIGIAGAANTVILNIAEPIIIA